MRVRKIRYKLGEIGEILLPPESVTYMTLDEAAAELGAWFFGRGIYLEFDNEAETAERCARRLRAGEIVRTCGGGIAHSFVRVE